MKRAMGEEIVQVEGGHILRSTNRKDRHSKVYTSKGPRDRRVRLSAHTAIQFYDMQDRLGFDRPSKAVEWLIKKAKSEIDKLSELPPWNPNKDVVNNMPTSAEVDNSSGCALEPQPPSDSPSRFLFQRHLAGSPSSISSSYAILAPVVETQSVRPDASKLLFPMNSGTSLMNFLSFPHDHVMSRESIQTEDLGLSLHSNSLDQNSNHRTSITDQSLFSSPNPVSFEATYPRMTNWILPHQQLFTQGGTFSHRESLQSNFSQLIHAYEQRPMTGARHQSSIFNEHFQFPARVHGEVDNGVICIKPTSDSFNSNHQ